MTLENRSRIILKNLASRSKDIEASAVMTRDGNLVSSVMRPELEGGRIAAMCAALLGLSDTAATELNRGELKLVLVHGEKGVLLLIQVGAGYVLAISATTEIKLGSLLLEAKKTAAELLTVLEQ